MVVAKGAIVDKDSSALTLFSTISGFRAEGFPLLMPQLAIGALLRRPKKSKATKYPLGLTITHNNDVVASSKIEIDFQDKFNNHVAITMQGMVIPSPGRIAFTLSTKGKQLGSFYFDADGPQPLAGAVADKTSSSSGKAVATKKASKRGRKAKGG
jgi:hypothetical protein